METLIANESKISEIIIGSEKFTITDKRVLYNHPNNNAFIGINELRGIEMKELDVKFNRINIPSFQSIAPIIAFFWLIVVYVYYCSAKPEYSFGDLSPLFLAGFWCLGLLPTTLAILYIIQSVTSYTEKKILVNIIKTDSSFWLNQYYDLSCSDKLNQLTQTINNAIYK